MVKTFPFLKDYRTIKGAEGGFSLLKDDDMLNNVSEVPGVYIIEAEDRCRFPYPRWSSPVIYIGKSDTSLRRRLKEHRAILSELHNNSDYGIPKDDPWVSSRYQYMHRHGAKVYYYPCRGKQEAKEEEAKVIWQFYEKYRALPVGNAAKSYSKK